MPSGSAKPVMLTTSRTSSGPGGRMLLGNWPPSRLPFSAMARTVSDATAMAGVRPALAAPGASWRRRARKPRNLAAAGVAHTHKQHTLEGFAHSFSRKSALARAKSAVNSGWKGGQQVAGLLHQHRIALIARQPTCPPPLTRRMTGARMKTGLELARRRAFLKLRLGVEHRLRGCRSAGRRRCVPRRYP